MTGLVASRSAPTHAAHPRRWLAAWCSYEWACSTYPAIILSFVFGPYFAKHVASNSVTGTVLWGNAMAISAVAIALLSPVCVALSDKGGRRKINLAGPPVPSQSLQWYRFGSSSRIRRGGRSLMARLSPPELRNQMFGLCALAGRATAPIGPFFVSWLIAITSSQRAGLTVVIVLTALGPVLLLPVREPRR